MGDTVGFALLYPQTNVSFHRWKFSLISVSPLLLMFTSPSICLFVAVLIFHTTQFVHFRSLSSVEIGQWELLAQQMSSSCQKRTLHQAWDEVWQWTVRYSCLFVQVNLFGKCWHLQRVLRKIYLIILKGAISTNILAMLHSCQQGNCIMCWNTATQREKYTVRSKQQMKERTGWSCF